MPTVRPILLLRIFGFGILAGALLLTSGSAGAKPDPAPFQPGSPAVTTYGPCQLGDAAIPWKCLHYKLQEARRLDTDSGCSQPAVVVKLSSFLYWRCETADRSQ